jgi:hypothetical protein
MTSDAVMPIAAEIQFKLWPVRSCYQANHKANPLAIGGSLPESI